MSGSDKLPDPKSYVWWRRFVVVLTLAALIAVVWSIFAPPRDADAHMNSCTHGDHYKGHGGVYLVMFRLEYELRDPSRRDGRLHVHMVDVYSGRNWVGIYEDFRQRRHVVCDPHSKPRTLPESRVPRRIPGHPNVDPRR